MFDLFLGMGRANKKDKDKDREKSNAYSIEGAKEDPDDDQSKAVAVPQAEGRLVERECGHCRWWLEVATVARPRGQAGFFFHGFSFYRLTGWCSSHLSA